MLLDGVTVTALVLVISLGSSSPFWDDGLEGSMEMDNFLLGKEEEGKFPKFLVQVFPTPEGHQHQSVRTHISKAFIRKTLERFQWEAPRIADSECRERDLEVVLNSGPVISPDILFNTLRIQDTPGEVSPTEPGSGTETGSSGIPNVRALTGRGFNGFPWWPQVQDDYSSFNDLSGNSIVGQQGVGRGNPREVADITKMNASSGGFRFNFSQDAKFLVVSPELSSRLVLTCDPVDLGNCSSVPDTLVINNVGDIRFGRNSFIYCGLQAKVRVVSLRRKISIRIRRDFRAGEMECKFFSRKQRFLEGDERSCGKLGEGRNAKIIGGREITPGLFPYLAQLDLTKSSGVHTTCSGSLISDSWVLTAAHCLRGVEAATIYLGGTDRKEFNGNEMLIQAEKFILHKNWNSKTLLGDIALVKLSKRIKYTEEISPVCLPDKKLRNENLNGKTGVATGWGRVATTERAPRKAYRVRLPFLSDLRCFLSYPRFFRPKVMMCTESTEEKAICYGDSGGPLLFLRNQRVYQVGISSYSSSQVCGESFDVFTRLDDNYVEWINKRIEE